MKKKAKRKRPEESAEGTGQIPPASFASHVLMLSTGALQHLGLIANPLTQKEEKNLPLARHTIDTLQVLKEKTKGNLEEEEERLLDELLYDLRMKFVKLSGQKQ